MKSPMFAILALLSYPAYAQNTAGNAAFNKLVEIQGSDFVLATTSHWGKAAGTGSELLLFIDTKNGQSQRVELPLGAEIESVDQVKIDELGIDRVVLVTRTLDLDGKKGISWNDPKQLFVLSANGQNKTQLTDNKLFVGTWTGNRKTGTLIVSGHYDLNNDSKLDRSDKNEIAIYDLRTLELVSRL